MKSVGEPAVDAALLIPAYNVERYIADLIDDAKAQTLKFKEIIVYDDCSADRTIEVAEQCGARVIRGSNNGGAAYARNRLLEAANTAWVHFHDADDRMDRRFLEILFPLAVQSGTHVLCRQEVRDRSTGHHISSVGHTPVEDDALAYFIEQLASYASIGVYRTDRLREVNGFDESLRGNEDPDLHVRLALTGDGFRWCDVSLSTNLLRSDSYSAQNWLRCMQDRMRCLLRYEPAALSRAQRSALGRSALWTADKLWRLKDRRAAREGLGLVRRCGIARADVGSRTAQVLSRVLGFECLFWARDTKDAVKAVG